MPLSPPAPRQKKHTRTIAIEGFLRDDGLWEIEGKLTDVKTFETRNGFKVRPAGDYHHEMYVRLTIDTGYNVRDVEVVSDNNPHDDGCRTTVPDYRNLVGLNLARGFRKAVQERMGGVKGCTHLNELLGVMPTGALQTMAGTVNTLADPKSLKMVLDRCAAWDRSGDIVKRHLPEWYIEKKPGDAPRGE